MMATKQTITINGVQWTYYVNKTGDTRRLLLYYCGLVPDWPAFISEYWTGVSKIGKALNAATVLVEPQGNWFSHRWKCDENERQLFDAMLDVIMPTRVMLTCYSNGGTEVDMLVQTRSERIDAAVIHSGQPHAVPAMVSGTRECRMRRLREIAAVEDGTEAKPEKKIPVSVLCGTTDFLYRQNVETFERYQEWGHPGECMWIGGRRHLTRWTDEERAFVSKNLSD